MEAVIILDGTKENAKGEINVTWKAVYLTQTHSGVSQPRGFYQTVKPQFQHLYSLMT